MGHKERFAPSRLSGGVGFRKRPFAPDNQKTPAGWAAALLLYRLGPLVRGSNLIELGGGSGAKFLPTGFTFLFA